MKIIQQKLDINSKYFLVIIKALTSVGGTTRLVGGAVRDAMLAIMNNNLESKTDIDFATDLLPEQVIDALKLQNIKAIPTGIKFGTITAIIQNESFEITTLRKDIKCDGRHADVEYSKDFMIDAARRDFTCNALSYCPITNKIYDYFDGIEDLKNRKVRFIGDPISRIQEDYLRIIRFFRFSAKYAKALDRGSLDACIQSRHGLTNISGERIKSEMDSILSYSIDNFDNANIILSMFNSGVLQVILPIKNYDHLIYLKSLQIINRFTIKAPLSVMYAILFSDLSDMNYKQLINLKFSKTETNNILKLLELRNLIFQCDVSSKQKNHCNNRILVWLKNIWLEKRDYVQYFVFADLFAYNNDVIKLFAQLKDQDIHSFPLNGHDVQKLGYTNKAIGDIIHLLKMRWLNSGFTLTYSMLIDLAKEKK